MSYYPKEGNPLWEQYSTKAVAQTLKTTAATRFIRGHLGEYQAHRWSTPGCFNYGRCEADGTYSERLSMA